MMITDAQAYLAFNRLINMYKMGSKADSEINEIRAVIKSHAIQGALIDAAHDLYSELMSIHLMYGDKYSALAHSGALKKWEELLRKGE